MDWVNLQAGHVAGEDCMPLPVAWGLQCLFSCRGLVVAARSFPCLLGLRSLVLAVPCPCSPEVPIVARHVVGARARGRRHRLPQPPAHWAALHPARQRAQRVRLVQVGWLGEQWPQLQREQVGHVRG